MNPASWKVVRRPASTDGDLEGFDLLFDSIRQVQTELAAFLSVEGVFIPTQAPLPHSSVLRFRVLLPDDFALIEGTGVVFWLRLPDEGGTQPAGMAVNFVTLGERSRELIEKIVETNLNAGGKPFDVHSKAEGDVPLKPPKPVPPAARQGGSMNKVTLGMRQGAQESAKVGMSFSVRGSEPNLSPPAPVQPVIPPPPIEFDPNATVWAPPKPKTPPVTAPVEDFTPPVVAERPVEEFAFEPPIIEPPIIEPPIIEPPIIEPPIIESLVMDDIVEPEPQGFFDSEDAAPVFEQVEELELELDEPEDEPEFAKYTQETKEALPKIDDLPTIPFAPVIEDPDSVDFEVDDPVPGANEPTNEILLDKISEDDDALMAEEPSFWVEDEDDVKQPADAFAFGQPQPHEFQPPASFAPEPEVSSSENFGAAGFADAGELEPPSWGEFDDADVADDSDVSEDVAAASPEAIVDPYAEQRETFAVPEPASSPVKEAQGQEFVFHLPDSEPDSATIEDESATPASVKTHTKKHKRHSSGRISPRKKSPISQIVLFIILAAAVGAGGYFGWLWYQDQVPLESEITTHEGSTEVIDSEPASDPAADHDAHETVIDAAAETDSSGGEPASITNEPAMIEVQPAPTPVAAEDVRRAVAMGPAHIVTGITWQQSPSGTDVVIECDGHFDDSQLSVFPMDDPPRILVRLRKIDAGYPDEIIEAGTDELQRIRIGFHPEQSPPALYVVLDVSDTSVVLLNSEADANILRVKLGRK